MEKMRRQWRKGEEEERRWGRCRKGRVKEGRRMRRMGRY